MLRIALIGCGGHAESAHGPALAHFASQHPGEVDLVAACDLKAERAQSFCNRFGFARPYTDMEAMLDAATPDAAVCAVPVEKIAETGIRLLARAIPCTVEKPLGRSRDEMRSLVEAAREFGTPQMVSVNRRFNPFLREAVECIRAAGALRYVRGQMYRRERRESEFVWGTGIHIVDAMRYIAGEIERLDVRMPVRSGTTARSVVVALRFASGCEGTIEVLPDAGMSEETYEMFGDGFRARATTLGPRGESIECWVDGSVTMARSADPAIPLFLRDGSYEETCAFIQGLRDGVSMRPTIEDVSPSMEICWQIMDRMEAL